jgi:hypothetical protein
VANFTLLISATGIFTRSFDRIRLKLRSVSDSWCAEIDAFFPVTGRYQALYLALRTVSSNLTRDRQLMAGVDSTTKTKR